MHSTMENGAVSDRGESDAFYNGAVSDRGERQMWVHLWWVVEHVDVCGGCGVHVLCEAGVWPFWACKWGCCTSVCAYEAGLSGYGNRMVYEVGR
jgi:hypothetical protein